MADYLNPMSMFQNVNQTPNNPFWSGYQGAINQQTAAPFIEDARLQSGYETQKKAMETGEFLGSEAQGMRSAERRAKTAGFNYDIATKPEEARLRQQQISEEIRALPHVTDEKIAKAKQAIMTAEGMPHRELLAEIGSSYDTLRDTPEEQRPQVWQSMVQRWQMSHPGAQIPNTFLQYSPQHLADAAAIRYNQLNSSEQIGKERLEDMRQSGETVRTNMQGQYAQQRAETSANAHIRGAEITHGRESPAQAEARLRRELRADPGNDESRRELMGYVQERFDQRFQRDTMGQMLAVQASSDPKKMTQFQVYKEQAKARMFMDEGLYGEISPEGRDWVMRAIAANPNMGLENVIQEGRQRGKFKKVKK